MYVPAAFRPADPDAAQEILEGYPFALLVTAEDGVPAASHLPLLYDGDDSAQSRLLGHLARANGQCRQLAAVAARGGEVLAVFQGPHAYVSPSDYGAGPPVVPTWNYLAVHIYGVPRLIEDSGEARAVLERLTARQETGRARPWSPASLEAELMERMLRAIQAFEIAVTRVEATAKLSQNRTPEQAARAAAALAAAEDSGIRETGRRMAARLAVER